jgi:hypothetical protein
VPQAIAALLSSPCGAGASSENSAAIPLRFDRKSAGNPLHLLGYWMHRRAVSRENSLLAGNLVCALKARGGCHHRPIP